MKEFDDFDLQRQADEYEWEEEFWTWYNTQNFPYKGYEVQGSDDLIYEWAE